jgi:Ca-activated chloride channel family protein
VESRAVIEATTASTDGDVKTMRLDYGLKVCLGAALMLAPACGMDSSDASAGGGEGGGGGFGVGQGGAQDFGQFRAILDAGEIPGPETLDDVGFFNEHKLELPPADCGQDVCVHGELGVMGNMITGSNCTLVMLGMNTAVDPSEMERPPLNLAIVVDTSGSMMGDPIAYLREGLFRMLDDLQPEDRISLVAFSSEAAVVAEHVAGDDPMLSLAIGNLSANGQTNIYDGLRMGYELVERYAEPGLQNRLILLSDGEATAGITSPARLVNLSTEYSLAGYALSTIGVGEEFDPALMRELSETGSGAFYFLEDPSAVVEVFEEEVKTFLVPLAQDVVVDLVVDPGYSLRAIYGTKNAQVWGNTGHLEIPSLQIAHRTSVDDNANGRRGGGGAIIAELVPRSPGEVAEAGTVGSLQMTYDRPSDGEAVEQAFKITTALQPGDTPEAGEFSFTGVEKAFVMLNVFAGFEMASTRAAYGDYNGALAVLVPLSDGVEAWLEGNPDADIEDDLRYIDKFIANLQAKGGGLPPPESNPPEPWPQD